MSNTGSGGSYTINEQGERVLTEAPTADHPEGNRPREAAAPVTATEPKPAKKYVAHAITPDE